MRTFAGTPCGIEGDDAATEALHRAFEAIGGRPFELQTAGKALYHAAAVTTSNYLTALVDAALELYCAAGIEESAARDLMAPLASEALAYALSMPTHTALTGPIARGDHAVIENHLRALRALGKPESTELYRALGIRAVQLARAQGRARPQDLDRIEGLLER